MIRFVDLFAGGGGASEGIRSAGAKVVLAANHCEHAIRMHEENHPDAIHLHSDVFKVHPRRHFRRRGSVDGLWASPDCRHFSRAKGGRPKSPKIRALAWVVVEWAREVRPRVICVENVPEFLTWGPLDDAGRPIKARAGETFRQWVGELRLHGYTVEWRTLRACDYGTPTTRKRLFLVARCDGEPIVWPEPTHGPGLLPYRTAAECIDWSIPAPSIFTRRRPLAEATQRRIAAGLKRFVLECPEPYIVRIGHQSSDAGKVKPIREPLTTVTTKNEHLLVAPWLANTRNGERKGQRPRVRSLLEPAPTVTATGSQGALVAAWLAKHYTGVVGQPMTRPLGTVTAKDHHSLVAAFLSKYYGTAVGQDVREPLHTIPTRDRFGLVTVELAGETYAVVDIGMRMLQPRELARAQGFPDSYKLIGNKSQQIARIGNSVCPQVVEALVRAQFGLERDRAAA